ncbi:hypothetical protein F511_37057 [Dorcoceras hygrometricum]|uniref:Uncharacterized protein n=1 Tax=Dorcoceras hygrometricum TaxID=472368 RepID=A0A2Z7CWB8_9LAMI|nr:hypothetical protein F511_37057 [Dorcoceras hygrometricum]
MKSGGDKRSSRKYDSKVLVAEESTKSWADSDSESSSSSSSSSESEQEEVHWQFAQIWNNAKFALTLCDFPLGGAGITVYKFDRNSNGIYFL